MTARPAAGAVSWRLFALAVLAGLAAAAGQAPLGLWWLALAGHGVLAWLVASAPAPRAAFRRAALAGTAHFAAALSWIVEPFLIDLARHGWMAPFALALMAGGLGLLWGGAGWLAARLAPHPPARALAFAGILMLAETARGVVLTGFPWALPGHVWIDTPVAQLAALGGAEALTLLLLLAAALPVVMGNSWNRLPRWRAPGVSHPRTPVGYLSTEEGQFESDAPSSVDKYPRGGPGGQTAPPVLGFALAVALVAAAWAGGAWRLARPDPPAPPDVPVLRLVQPHAEQEAKWDPVRAREHFDRLLDLTAASPSGTPPVLAIWPETAVPYLLDGNPLMLEAIAEAAAGIPVAVGIQRSDGGTRGWNSLAVIGPDAGVRAVYDKHHLVPFGEYVPFGDLAFRWLGLRAFAAQLGNGYSAGPGPELMDFGALGRVLPLICYEAIFARDLAGVERGDWILQVTNDAWFGTLTGPYQHFAQARLRAVEQGLPLVRVANTGISGLIDARGRVLASMPLGHRGFLDVALPGPLPAPPYAWLGWWPVLPMPAILILAAFAWSRRRRA